MKKAYFLFLISITFLNFSCGLKTGYFYYQGKENEIIATKKIKNFMKENKEPSIVLRVPDAVANATKAEGDAFIYNAIEKELVIAGFDVKDRAVFNEIVNKSEELNYKSLKELTNTDFILELIRVHDKIEHNTNVFYTKKGKQKIVRKGGSIVRYGKVLEFKLVLLEKNEYGGSYSFYETPCKNTSSIKDNCLCNIGHKGRKIYTYENMCQMTRKERRKMSKQGFDLVREKDEYEQFIRNGVKQMIEEITK